VTSRQRLNLNFALTVKNKCNAFGEWFFNLKMLHKDSKKSLSSVQRQQQQFKQTSH
jgi:hypothetical protein